MEVDAAPGDLLLHRPWVPVNISGSQFLVKTLFRDSSYHILLTDMNCVWEERMDSSAIQRRSQELNKRLRAPVKAFFSHLCEVVQPCLSQTSGGSSEQTAVEAELSLQPQEDDSLMMRLKSELAGLPFHWKFHCTPAPVTLVCDQLLRPLLTMSRLLQQQVEQLGALMVRKDAEIQDYRENGAVLSRERLQTDVFEKDTYRQDFIKKVCPLLSSEKNTHLGFSQHLQQLYGSVVAQEIIRGQKRKLSEEMGVKDAPSAAEEPDLTPSLDAGSMNSNKEVDRNHVGQTEKAGSPSAVVQQSQPPRSDLAERPPSKPKKKKVGIFR
ncbi:non-homologous end-joining factor 1 [Cynoglossus semilaevis]|uniref:non-homologous end-joining factor 1 n=1 Tax=Cynoglossus semilaevis TaxID=244447 RepID=UPI0004980AB5|nr:non-homologous end-joining factor 1 [Cynoglossus semilaevis]